MKSLLKIGIAAALVGTAITSCKKYEDGPIVSLTPREERVANTWIFAYAEQNGENVSEDFDNYDLYLSEEGEAELDASYMLLGTEYESSTDGKWLFSNDEENLILDFEDDNEDEQYRILRLREEELWLKDLDQDLEIHLLPK